MFVIDDIYCFENEKRKEGDYLMACFVIHVSLLSLHNFLETAVLQNSLVFISWFSINHRNIDHHFSYEKVSCLKWVLRKRRYTENLTMQASIL